MDASAYLSQLIGLLPPGDALAREPGSVLERLLSVPAAELARVDGRVEALLLESDPARTTEMLADWERALGLPDVCYPNFQFSRASRAWYFDGAGVLREAAVDEPRYLFDEQGNRTEAVLVEAVATNFVANAWSGGAVVGTPGTLPTGFTVAGAPLALAEVTFTGLEDGLPCLELRIAGTLGAATDLDIAFTTTTATPAVVADVFTGSFFWRLITGTAPTNWRVRFEEYSSAGALLVGNQVDLVAATNAALRGQRGSSPYTVGNASAAFLRHVARLRFAAGAVNTTLRLAVPQLERGAVATSPILNPIGAPAATTRAADQLYIATVQERRERILARLIERFEPTPAAIIGLAARLGDSVTLTEFRPHDCEDDCEAPVLDDAWAHAFQVAGGAQQVVEFTCEDTSETPLSQWRTGRYECAIRRFAPAHTLPIFSYAGGVGGGGGGGGGDDGIVTSGLVMDLDTGNVASYPGTGATWTDLSGNGNNATLINGPTFSAANGGQIAFNGSTQFATMPRSVGASFSLELWINTTSSGGSSSGEWWDGLAILDADVSGPGNDFGLAIGAGRLMFGNGNPDSTLKTTSTYNTGNWIQSVATRNNTTGARQIFVNGVLVVGDTASTQSLNAATQMVLARFQSASVGFLACNVAIVRAYNIAFSPAQVAQNFNANRGRFGL